MYERVSDSHDRRMSERMYDAVRTCTRLPCTPQTPWSREGLIQLLETVEDWQDETNSFDYPTVIHCMDGASQSGLFVACSIVTEVMQVRAAS